MNNEISVIVPVYNVEKFLPECLNSLINQTLKDIEIICVNDGSTDNSLKILKEYAKKDHRIKIINRKNGGLSAARNTGLEHIKTKYVMFCDSDDYYEPTMCEKMLRAIKKNDTDIVACGTKIKYLAHNELSKSDEVYYKIKFSGEHDMNEVIIQKTDVSVCNKIFKADFIKKYHINFPEKLNNEDYYFWNAYASISKTIYFLPQKLYNYIRRENGSIMSDMFNKSTYSPDHLLIAEKLFAFYEKNDFLNSHANLFWHQFSESFWFSYNHSSEKYHKDIQQLGNQFIDKNYLTYPPTKTKVKYKINEIRHNNLIHKIIRRIKYLLSN